MTQSSARYRDSSVAFFVLAATASSFACSREVQSTVTSCPSCPSVEAPAPGQPPFTSISSAELPSAGGVTWRLEVYTHEDVPDIKRFEVSSKRAGDVSLPSSLRWKCRFNHVEVDKLPKGLMVMREVRCSSDQWRTSVGGTGSVLPGEAPVAGEVDLYDGEKLRAGVTWKACTATSQCAAAPELP